MVIRKGKHAHSFVLNGFVIDDPDIWGELFDHHIASLE